MIGTVEENRSSGIVLNGDDRPTKKKHIIVKSIHPSLPSGSKTKVFQFLLFGHPNDVTSSVDDGLSIHFTKYNLYCVVCTQSRAVEKPRFYFVKWMQTYLCLSRNNLDLTDLGLCV